jgi:hypothetical protein
MVPLPMRISIHLHVSPKTIRDINYFAPEFVHNLRTVQRKEPFPFHLAQSKVDLCIPAGQTTHSIGGPVVG